MSNTSSFPSETLLLYQSKPTEILATENVAQASTAGQWVGDKGCPVKETSHFPTLQNSHSSKKKRMWTHLLWFSEASRQCHFLVWPHSTVLEHPGTRNHSVMCYDRATIGERSHLSSALSVLAEILSSFCWIGQNDVICEANFLEMKIKVS